MHDINERLENARRQLEDIITKRTQAGETIRQLELNEAAWLGFIEALTPYVSDEENEIGPQDVFEN
jgi:hypothetical protein